MLMMMKAAAELIPYENNPRDNEEAVKYVAESIKQFGFKVPIVIDKDNVIVAGHTRLKAAQELGIEEVPCIVADDLTEEQIKAFRLADNKTSEFAKWDFDLLESELADLEAAEFDMGVFDFDVNFSDQDEDDSDEPEEAEAPEDFKEYGDDIETEHKCPMCGYEW